MSHVIAPKCRHPDCGVRHWPNEGHSARYCAIWGGDAGNAGDEGVSVRLSAEAAARFGFVGGVEVGLDPAVSSVPPELPTHISVPSAVLEVSNSVPPPISRRGRPKVVGEPWVAAGMTRRTWYRHEKARAEKSYEKAVAEKAAAISRFDDDLPI